MAAADPLGFTTDLPLPAQPAAAGPLRHAASAWRLLGARAVTLAPAVATACAELFAAGADAGAAPAEADEAAPRPCSTRDHAVPRAGCGPGTRPAAGGGGGDLGIGGQGQGGSDRECSAVVSGVDVDNNVDNHAAARSRGGAAGMSSDEAIERLARLYAHVFATVDPQDEYYKATDPIHGPAVLRWAAELADGPVPLALAAAALFHDIERYAPALRVPRLPCAALDETIRKQVLHPLNCSRILEVLMEACGFAQSDIDATCLLVRHHDRVSNDAVTLDLDDADAAALGLPAGRLTVLEAAGDVFRDPAQLEQLRVLQFADSATFFTTSIAAFILHSLDDRGAPHGKVVARVRNNMLRIGDRGAETMARIIESARQVCAVDPRALAVLADAVELFERPQQE